MIIVDVQTDVVICPSTAARPLRGNEKKKYRVGDVYYGWSETLNDYFQINGGSVTDIVDWSSGAAVVGFAVGMTTNKVYYVKVGKLVTMTVEFLGTSNSTAITFTLPFAAAHNQYPLTFLVTNNATTSNNPGRLSLSTGSTLATATQNRQGAAWTNSGQKYFVGTFSYLAAA